MMYLLWAILNIGLFIAFIIICFKATKLICSSLGSVATLIFVFGLLSFIGTANSKGENLEPNTNHVKTWKFNSTENLDAASNGFIEVELEKILISKYSLGIQYAKGKELKNNIPTEANTWMTGLIGGTSWKPEAIAVNRTDDNQRFAFDVNGTLKWKLLGLTVYSQLKNWNGFALLK